MIFSSDIISFMVFNNNKTPSAKYEKEIENIAHFRLL